MLIHKSVSAMLLVVLLSTCSVAQARPARTDLTQALAVTGKADRQKTQRPPLVEKYLLQGNLADGETAMEAELARHAGDDQLRFGLGVLQFLRGVEHLAQDLHRYGLRDMSGRGLRVPMLRLPVPENPQPETLTYAGGRSIVESFRASLMKADATLSPIADENVKLPLHFGLIKLDLNRDGRVDEDETLWKVYAGLSANTRVTREKSQEFNIKFDRGDVHWLRGYCHLLAALCDIYLAHDSRETFDTTAHLFFPKVDTPYPYLNTGKHVRNLGGSDVDILDIIALVHTISWPVVEPKRMEDALHHFETVVAQSRESWKWIMAETDNDREWLPNPKQTTVIPNIRVTDEMASAWMVIMGEIQQILAGELLIPFWRGEEVQGINLRKVFLEPQRLDLVLWIQGSAAKSYLQKGPMSKGDTWRTQMNEFGRHFPGFVVWFN